jgi:hypothetical protein
VIDRLPPLGVPFDELSIEVLREALPPGEYEPLTWEAKGTQATRQNVRRQVAGFANSRTGGILILGADQPVRNGPWVFDGVELPDEPIAWLDQVIRDGLRPVPRYVPRVLWSEGGRSVVAIEVWPLADPPCITSDGQVFQRVSGRTIPVATPTDLARLYGLGDTARLRASTASRAALRRILVDPPDQDPAHFLCGVAIASLAEPEEPTAIHRQSFIDDVDAMLIPFSTSPVQYTQPRHRQRAQTLDIYLLDFNRVEGVFLGIDFGGAVAVGRTDPDRTEPLVHIPADDIHRLADLALRVIARLGLVGACHITAWARGGDGLAWADRWLSQGTLDQASVEAMAREISRGQGRAVLEPEP